MDYWCFQILKAADAMVASTAAHLLELLDNRAQNLTVFVPVNKAFKDYQVWYIYSTITCGQNINE